MECSDERKLILYSCVLNLFLSSSEVGCVIYKYIEYQYLICIPIFCTLLVLMTELTGKPHVLQLDSSPYTWSLQTSLF